MNPTMNKKLILAALFFLSLFSYLSCTPVSEARVKNVIFYIGDGMGISQIAASRIYLQGANGRFNIEKMPITGLITTHSVDKLITDSAAGATAMATGYKTKNGIIGLSADSLQLYTILEAARDKGFSTGLIATSAVTHATPACFAAHVISRRDQDIIASQLLSSEVSLLLGGGRAYFIPQNEPLSKRLDERNLISEAIASGYQLIGDKDQLKTLSKLPALGLFAADELSHQPTEPSLKEMTQKSLELLSTNEKGFFLMVEGSQIDWAGHENDFQYLVKEMIDFDEAVAVGLDFAVRNQNTLVLVTADHETGGLQIVGGQNDGKDIRVEWHNTSHTGTPVPIFAAGAQAQLFSGVKDNSEIPVLLSRLLGIKNFPARPRPLSDN